MNTAINAAGNAAENNFVPVLVAGAVIAMQIATVVDAIETSLKFKKAIERGDTDAAIAEGIALAMLTVPGQKLIPAPLRNAVKKVVTSSVTRILHSKYGQAAVKAGGAALDAASSKVQNLANKAANSKAGQAIANSKVGKGLQNAGDRLVQHVEDSTAHQAEKGVAKDIDLRVKPKAQTTAPAADKNYFDGNSKIKQLDRKGFVEFDGVEFRGVRDLSHIPDEHLFKMYEKGYNPIDINMGRLDGHHHLQKFHRDPDAFVVEIPFKKHNIKNEAQHPFGNKKDAGLTKEQRDDWNKLRTNLNKERAGHELKKRGLLDE